MTTPFMNMPEIKVGKSNDYVKKLSDSFNIVDSHEHNTIGKTVNQSSIDWNNTDFNLFGIKNLNYLDFYNLNQNVSNVCSLYVKNNDLFYVDGNNNVIQITKSGSINSSTALSGGFTGDYITANASCIYNDSTKTYSFYAPNNGSSVIICNNIANITDLACNNLIITNLNTHYLRPSYYDNIATTRYRILYYNSNKEIVQLNYYTQASEVSNELVNSLLYQASFSSTNKSKIKTVNVNYIEYASNPVSDYILYKYFTDPFTGLNKLLQRNVINFSGINPGVTISTPVNTGRILIGIIGRSYLDKTNGPIPFTGSYVVLPCLDGVVFRNNGSYIIHDCQMQYFFTG